MGTTNVINYQQLIRAQKISKLNFYKKVELTYFTSFTCYANLAMQISITLQTVAGYSGFLSYSDLNAYHLQYASFHAW